MAKTKALISFTVTAKLISVFAFAYAKSRFSHDVAQMGVSRCQGVRCLSGRVSGARARVGGSNSAAAVLCPRAKLYSLKVLAIHRKRWNHPDMF